MLEDCNEVPGNYRAGQQVAVVPEHLCPRPLVGVAAAAQVRHPLLRQTRVRVHNARELHACVVELRCISCDLNQVWAPDEGKRSWTSGIIQGGLGVMQDYVTLLGLNWVSQIS